MRPLLLPPLLLLLAVVGVTSSSARAEDPVFAGVAPRDGSVVGASARVEQSLGDALQSFGVLRVAPAAAAAAHVSADELNRALTSARNLTLEGGFAKALAVTDDALHRFEEGAAYDVDANAWHAYGELLVVRAVCLRRLSQEPESDEALLRFAAALPGALPNPDFAPPKISTRHAQIAAELAARTPASLEITSQPAGADVVVDGRVVGQTPLVVPGLLAGTHFMSLRKGAAHAERRVRIDGPRTTVDAALDDPDRPTRITDLVVALRAPLSEARLGQLASAAGADVVTGVVVDDQGVLALVVTRLRDGHVRSLVGTHLDGALKDLPARTKALAETVVAKDGERWLDGPGTPRDLFWGTHSGTNDAVDDGGALVWVGVGVGAVAVVGGAIAGVILYLSSNPGGTHVAVDASNL